MHSTVFNHKAHPYKKQTTAILACSAFSLHMTVVHVFILRHGLTAILTLKSSATKFTDANSIYP